MRPILVHAIAVGGATAPEDILLLAPVLEHQDIPFMIAFPGWINNYFRLNGWILDHYAVYKNTNSILIIRVYKFGPSEIISSMVEPLSVGSGYG